MKRFQFSAIVSTPIGAQGTLEFPGFIVNGQYTVTMGDKTITATSPDNLLQQMTIILNVAFLEFTAPDSCITNIVDIPDSKF